MYNQRGIFKLRSDLQTATKLVQPLSRPRSLTRRHYDYGRPVAVQSGIPGATHKSLTRSFPAPAPPETAYPTNVEPFGAVLPLPETHPEAGNSQPVLTVEAIEKQTYHPGLHVEGENGTIHSGANPCPQPSEVQTPAPALPAGPPRETPAIASGFDFDRADQSIYSGNQSAAPPANPDFDSFERELAHLLSGNVPERVAKKVEEIDRQNGSAGTPPQMTPPPAAPAPPPAPPANPHDIFDQIAASRLNSRVFDLGSFEVQKQKLDDFDALLEKRQPSKKTEAPQPEPTPEAEVLPMSVAMSDLDLAEDFHRMGIALGKDKASPAKGAPEQAPAAPAQPPASPPARRPDAAPDCVCPPENQAPESQAPASPEETPEPDPTISESSQPTSTS